VQYAISIRRRRAILLFAEQEMCHAARGRRPSPLTMTGRSRSEPPAQTSPVVAQLFSHYVWPRQRYAARFLAVSAKNPPPDHDVGKIVNPRFLRPSQNGEYVGAE